VYDVHREHAHECGLVSRAYGRDDEDLLLLLGVYGDEGPGECAHAHVLALHGYVHVCVSFPSLSPFLPLGSIRNYNKMRMAMSRP